MKENFIVGLDIGSKEIKIAIGKIQESNIPEILVAVSEPSSGINKGVITDLEESVTSLSRALEKAERMLGQSITHACVGISGLHIITQNSRGVVAVSNVHGEIKEEDIQRVLEAAAAVATPPNYEILHVIPLSFTVDSQPGIKDPLGMTGVRLEVEAQVIEGLSNQIKNLNKSLRRVGLLVDDLVFSILACAEAVLDRRQKELGVAVVNLGSTTTSLAVFEEGDLLLAKVLPIGSQHITSDLAIGLRVSIDVAESVKLLYGSCLSEKISKEEKIDLSEFDEKGGIFSKKEIVEIIEARCEEIFKLVDKELSSIKRSGKLPAGIVLTGGGAKLNQLTDLAKEVLKLPVSLGLPKNIIFTFDQANDPIFTTAIGLIVWAKELKIFTKSKPFGFKEIFKNIFKKILP
ncbi:MAG: cell division protein FtsA [Patescibacteria group bacterium]